MQTCINTEQGIMDDSFAKFQRNEGILEATTTMCDGFEREYQDAEAARRDELALIDALYALVKERQANKRDVSARMDYNQDQSVYEYESPTAPGGGGFI